MINFFTKTVPSAQLYAGGVRPEDQLYAISKDRYWTVLNTSILRSLKNCSDDLIVPRVNAIKHAIQTYGPIDKQKLPDFRQNTGQAKGHVFHGHAQDSLGKTYVLEWAIINWDKRQVALIGFGSHENYAFRQTPLSPAEIKAILSSPETDAILRRVVTKTEAAKKKVERIEKNYRHQTKNSPTSMAPR